MKNNFYETQRVELKQQSFLTGIHYKLGWGHRKLSYHSGFPVFDKYSNLLPARLADISIHKFITGNVAMISEFHTANIFPYHIHYLLFLCLLQKLNLIFYQIALQYISPLRI